VLILKNEAIDRTTPAGQIMICLEDLKLSVKVL
jgi:hypothetical protein